MTQKDLAEMLHITDRAVSKWERGLCAPDISLLEPLAKALGITITELLEGNRTEKAMDMQELEQSTKNVIDYSKNEIAHKVRHTKKKYLGMIAVCLVLVMTICSVAIWRGGYLFTIDRKQSPDEQVTITVYERALSDTHSFFTKEGISLMIEHKNGQRWYVTYGDCIYRGIWWAPDSKKYVLALEYEEGTRLALSWLENNAETNLSACLSIGVEATELKKYGYKNEGGWPQIDYQFLQWGLDSASMLMYYSFEDQSDETHDGYFWYNCEDGTVAAVLEL